MTSSFLLIVLVLLTLLKGFFAIRESINLIKRANKNSVVLVNNEVVLTNSIKGDTINLYIKSSSSDVVEIIAPDSVKLK